jgi:Trk K+ transport system NAD-binding subunit
LLREISADRAADYNAFVRAVQSDEAQEFTLERAGAESSKQAASATSNPKKN